jgi:hypothetical protein
MLIIGATLHSIDATSVTTKSRKNFPGVDPRNISAVFCPLISKYSDPQKANAAASTNFGSSNPMVDIGTTTSDIATIGAHRAI